MVAHCYQNFLHDYHVYFLFDFCFDFMTLSHLQLKTVFSLILTFKKIILKLTESYFKMYIQYYEFFKFWTWFIVIINL